MIYNIKSEHPQIKVIENKIVEAVKIPLELRNNLKFSSTSLGGLFLQYFSNGHIKNVYKENAKTCFRLQICVGDGFGEYRGDNITMDVDRKTVYKMTSIKKHTTHDKIIEKLNKIISENKTLLIQNIETEVKR